jgi:hypothetical protein
MSPGTRRALSILTRRPPRSTLANDRVSEASASAAFMARHSWAVPMTALIWSTTKMKKASAHSPSTADTADAASSR